MLWSGWAAQRRPSVNTDLGGRRKGSDAAAHRIGWLLTLCWMFQVKGKLWTSPSLDRSSPVSAASDGDSWGTSTVVGGHRANGEGRTTDCVSQTVTWKHVCAVKIRSKNEEIRPNIKLSNAQPVSSRPARWNAIWKDVSISPPRHSLPSFFCIQQPARYDGGFDCDGTNSIRAVMFCLI